MKAVRVHPSPDSSKPYSAENPAPASALHLDSDVPVPQNLKSGDLLVKIEATTLVRDCLTWPESYEEEYKILGWDFAGTVVRVGPDVTNFKPEDQVFGMAGAARSGVWAEYAVVSAKETCLKPGNLSWPEAAAVPMNMLTAWQALYVQAGIDTPDFGDAREPRETTSSSNRKDTSVLVTGANGNVGLHVVQVARLAKVHVVAATRSNARNMDFLQELGADEIVEYDELAQSPDKRFDVVIDTIGGDMLKKCWSWVKPTGTIVAVEGASYDFAEEHKRLGLDRGCEGVRAKFFIVSPSSEDLEKLSAALQLGLLKSYVASVRPLAEAQQAYSELSNTSAARGKVVLTTG